MVLHKRLLDLNYSIEIVDPNIPETKSYDQVESFSKNVLISTFHDEFKHIDFSNKEVIIVGKNKSLIIPCKEEGDEFVTIVTRFKNYIKEDTEILVVVDNESDVILKLIKVI